MRLAGCFVVKEAKATAQNQPAGEDKSIGNGEKCNAFPIWEMEEFARQTRRWRITTRLRPLLIEADSEIGSYDLPQGLKPQRWREWQRWKRFERFLGREITLDACSADDFLGSRPVAERAPPCLPRGG